MTTALEGDEGSASRPGRSLPPRKTRYPLYRRLGGPKGRSGQVRKISPPPGFDPRIVQPVANRYTDYATRPTIYIYIYIYIYVCVCVCVYWGCLRSGCPDCLFYFRTYDGRTHKGRPNASFHPECWLVVRSAKMNEIRGSVVISFIYKKCGINCCNRWKAEWNHTRANTGNYKLSEFWRQLRAYMTEHR